MRRTVLMERRRTITLTRIIGKARKARADSPWGAS